MTTSSSELQSPEPASQPRAAGSPSSTIRVTDASSTPSCPAARPVCLSSVLTLISLPLAVRYLGAERYGVWATVVSVAVWVNLLDLGIANSLTNVVSQAYARQDRMEAARGLSNALAVTLGAVRLMACVSLRLLVASRELDRRLQCQPAIATGGPSNRIGGGAS